MRFIRVRAPIRFTSPVTTAAPAPIQDALTSAAQDAAAESRGESAQRVDSSPLGTGHGRREYSPARRVEFARQSERPDAVVAIRYDSVERLVARGVIPRPQLDWLNPEPFPALLGFVPDP